MFQTIPIGAIDQYIDRGMNLLLIDLRNRELYEKSHIKTAVNIPFQELEDRINELPKNKMLIFYCQRGGQSMQVCRTLDQLGYLVADVVSGIAYYRGKYLIYG